jgi:hypothetical protein
MRGRWRLDPGPFHGEVVVQALLTPSVIAELFVAAVLGWMGVNIHKTVRDPKTPPADAVLLDLGLVAVTALVLLFSASLKVFF